MALVMAMGMEVTAVKGMAIWPKKMMPIALIITIIMRKMMKRHRQTSQQIQTRLKSEMRGDAKMRLFFCNWMYESYLCCVEH